MQQETAEDWIDFIIKEAVEHYNGREIVIWGKYVVSDSIRDELKERYELDTAFYVDGDRNKTDGKMVLSPGHLCGKSDQYYVIVPIGFYQSVKETLTRGGIFLAQIIIIFVTAFCGRN